MRGSLVAFLLALYLANVALALTHLRRGPQSATAPPVVLHGSAVVDGYWGRGRSASRKRIAWSAKVKRDIVTWYDMSKDATTIRSCSSSHVTLSGPKLDPTDYRRRTVFVIDMADWESRCAPPATQRGIAEEDDVLFYEIIADPSVGADKSIKLQIRRIPGDQVVPEVDLDVSDGQGVSVPNAKEGEVAFFANNALGALSRQALVMPTAVRATETLEKNSTITTGVSLGFSAQVRPSIRSFKLRRLKPLKFVWEQSITTEASAHFAITRTLERTRTGRLIQKPVPGFGFRTRRIPFVGRASAGAFVRVDWVLELVAETTFSASFDFRRELRQEVKATIFRGSFSTKNLPPRVTNSQTASLQVGAQGTVNGFAGVRPALGVEVALGRKQAGGNIGVKIGLELETSIKTPPFEPPTESGLKVGVCDKCHALQGFLGVRVKDMSLQLERKDKITREITLLEDILGLRILTMCALPKPCKGTSPIPVIPPIELPESPTTRCRRCKSAKNCPPKYRCVKGQCMRGKLCVLTKPIKPIIITKVAHKPITKVAN